ncbi:hypothetical protein B0I37DRAFT_410915 [Chaetomium sp. MPI-CAGE-AT-0009]|nr:hypothetical protein B0I37DRAFT_410915 [Chaetomium sp. MPI-CAGE-AT-0009]
MASAETNHGSGDVGAQPSSLEQHGPPAQQTEHAPDSISLPQTPDTAQRARGLTDNDRAGADVGSLVTADLADGTRAAPAPWVSFPNSPPRPDARLTPSPPPTGLQPTHWGSRTTTWLQGQGPPIGLGLMLYPPAGDGAALAAGPVRDGDGAAATNGKRAPSGGKE